jgi:hypothetical protein
MISFIKKLFGFGSKETVTPTAAPYKIEPKETATAIEPAKPVIKTETVAAPPAPAKKNRRPRNRNRSAGGAVAKITEGATKGGTGAVKQPAPAKVAKVKSTKPKNQSK